MTGAQKVIIGEDTAKGLFPKGRAVGKTLALPVGNKNAAPLDPVVAFLLSMITLKSALNTLFSSIDCRKLKYESPSIRS